MKFVFLLFLIPLFGSCSKNPTPAATLENEVLADSKTNVEDPLPAAIQENEAISDSQDILGRGEVRNVGVYLPEYYIAKLAETKSHKVAANDFYEVEDSRIIEITIFEEEVMVIANFHDSGGMKISKFNDNEILFEQRRDFRIEIPPIEIIDGSTIKNENVIYKCVGTDVDDWRSQVLSFITEMIFGNRHYANEDGVEIYRIENGNVLCDGIEYEIHLDTVFSNNEYDFLRNREWETIHFKIINDVLVVYEQKIPEEYEDFIGVEYATYNPIDEFRPHAQ